MDEQILIVEDHQALRKSLMDWLKGVFPQCDFFEAESGEAAIEICRTITPVLILMDISLPGVNGIATTKRLLPIAPKARVIMLTIHEDEAYRSEAISAGASAYVTKRVMKTELIPTMKRLLEATESKRSKGMK